MLSGHIIWNYVEWFRMNLMKIEYSKAFIKHYNNILKHYKNSIIFWDIFKSYKKKWFFQLTKAITQNDRCDSYYLVCIHICE
jgi:hypothetical protein